MKRMRTCLVVVAIALAVAGCASGVRREGDAPSIAGHAVSPLPVSGVTVSLSPEAQKLAVDNPKFDQEKLLYTVKRGLEANGLMKSDAAPKVEIVVTEFRVKGTLSAVMLGALAGTDNVTGDVIVRDASGRQLRKFTVHATYGLGGVAGGQDNTRLTWLYEKFAEHTVAELGGPKKE
jgi:hypothetical protein